MWISKKEYEQIDMLSRNRGKLIEELNESRSELHIVINNLQDEINELENKITRLTNENEKARSKIDYLELEKQATKEQVEYYKNLIGKLEKEIPEVHKYMLKNKSIKELLAICDEYNIKTEWENRKLNKAEIISRILEVERDIKEL